MDEKKDEQNVEILIYLMESTWFNSMSPDEDELVNLSTGRVAPQMSRGT